MEQPDEFIVPFRQVLRYSSVSIAAAVMIARLSDQTVAHASSSVSDTGYEWACEDTAEAHHLHLYEIRSPASACKIGVKFAGPAGKMLPIIILLANIWQH